MNNAHTENFGTTDADSTIARPDTGSDLARAESLPWQQESGAGFAYKTLFEDLTTNQATLLMKVEAGALAAPHAHDQLEQVFVLEGTFYDEDRTYGPGNFVVRAPGALHTGGSEIGALVLLVYST